MDVVVTHNLLTARGGAEKLMMKVCGAGWVERTGFWLSRDMTGRWLRICWLRFMTICECCW